VCKKVTCKKPGGQVYKTPWLDEECIKLRQEIQSEPCNVIRGELSHRYKLLKQKKKREYKRKLLLELDDNCGNSRLFWKSFKDLPSAKNIPQANLNPEKVCNQLRQFSELPLQDYFDNDFQREIEVFLQSYDSECNQDHNCIQDMADMLNGIMLWSRYT
jgi:hypothetical protein